MSIGQGSISYNNPAGAQAGFINVAGARNGLSVDSNNFIVLGQDSGAVGDPAAMFNDRQIPVGRDLSIFLTDFTEFDPFTQIQIQVPSIILTSNQTVTGEYASITTGDSGLATTSVLNGNSLSLMGKTANGLSATLILNDEAAAGWNIGVDGNTGNTNMQWGAGGPTGGFTTFFTDGQTLITSINGLDNTNNNFRLQIEGEQSDAGALYVRQNFNSVTGKTLIIGNVFQADGPTDADKIMDLQYLGTPVFTVMALQQQVGINNDTPNLSAILDVFSTTRGFLPPRMTTTQKNGITNPAAGLIVFDTTLAKLAVFSGIAWQTITSI